MWKIPKFIHSELGGVKVNVTSCVWKKAVSRHTTSS